MNKQAVHAIALGAKKSSRAQTAVLTQNLQRRHFQCPNLSDGEGCRLAHQQRSRGNHTMRIPWRWLPIWVPVWVRRKYRNRGSQCFVETRAQTGESPNTRRMYRCTGVSWGMKPNIHTQEYMQDLQTQQPTKLILSLAWREIHTSGYLLHTEGCHQDPVSRLQGRAVTLLAEALDILLTLKSGAVKPIHFGRGICKRGIGCSACQVA